MSEGNINEEAIKRQQELDKKRNQVPVSSNAIKPGQTRDINKEVDAVKRTNVKSNLKKDTKTADNTQIFDKSDNIKTKKKDTIQNTTENKDVSYDGKYGKTYCVDKKGKKYPNSVGEWFVTISCIQIPVIGLIILLILAFFPKNINPAKKAFARGYLIYGLLVWALAALVIYLLYITGADFVDNVLSYIGKSVV